MELCNKLDVKLQSKRQQLFSKTEQFNILLRLQIIINFMIIVRGNFVRQCKTLGVRSRLVGLFGFLALYRTF